MTIVEFKVKWQHWQQEVLQLLDQGIFILSPQLNQLVQVSVISLLKLSQS